MKEQRIDLGFSDITVTLPKEAPVGMKIAVNGRKFKAIADPHARIGENKTIWIEEDKNGSLQ